MLQVIFFSIMLGVGIRWLDKGKPAANFFDAAAEAIAMKMTVIVMEMAPGVFALMAVVMADKGQHPPDRPAHTRALPPACCTSRSPTAGSSRASSGSALLPTGVRRPGRRPLDPSSGATLPVTITCVNENLGVDKSVASSVLSGATINMDGTAIYIGLVALFGAQALDIAVTPGQYFLVAIMATLVSIGAAGIPSAACSAAARAGRPQREQSILVIGFIYPFDRLLDMMRTLTNVTGDAAPPPSAGGRLRRRGLLAEDRHDPGRSPEHGGPASCPTASWPFRQGRRRPDRRVPERAASRRPARGAGGSRTSRRSV